MLLDQLTRSSKTSPLPPIFFLKKPRAAVVQNTVEKGPSVDDERENQG